MLSRSEKTIGILILKKRDCSVFGLGHERILDGSELYSAQQYWCGLEGCLHGFRLERFALGMSL